MLTKKELIILRELRSNARKSLAEISKKTNIPISTISNKLRKLEEGIIKKYVSLLDLSKLGYNLKVKFFVKLKNDQKEEGKNALFSDVNVNSLYQINGRYDFLVEGVFKGMDELGRFREKLERFVLEKKEHCVVEDIKKEVFLPAFFSKKPEKQRFFQDKAY